jgi:hypothetical protein
VCHRRRLGSAANGARLRSILSLGRLDDALEPVDEPAPGVVVRRIDRVDCTLDDVEICGQWVNTAASAGARPYLYEAPLIKSKALEHCLIPRRRR